MSCGRPYPLVQIVSLKTKTVCTENEVGEIWLHGESISQGYWYKNDVKKNYFEEKLEADSRLYFRTGDLGFLHQGELYLVGRIKDVIIINGSNYYPQDIEQTVLNCDELLQRATCACFRYRSTKSSITDGFVILVKSSKKISDEIKTTLTIKIRKQILKEYQLVPYDVQFVNFNFPKTTSGKLQRNACRQLYLDLCEIQQQREHYAE